MNMFFILVIFSISLMLAIAMPPVNVIASVRGKKYDVTADTVEEFTSKVEDLAGLEPGQQSVLFRGKVLSAEEHLDESGISEGDILNVVKGRKSRPAKLDSGFGDAGDDLASFGGGDIPSGGGGGMGDMMGGMGGMGGMTADSLKKMAENPEEMQKAMQAMDQLLDNDYFEEYFADEEKLEKARQQMLGNLDQYDQMMPGFKEQAREIASSPEKWREAMMQAKNQISNLRKQRDSMRAMQGGGGPSIADMAKDMGSSDGTDASYSGVDDIDEE